jgi:phosphatidate cytidylyltransferase
LLIVFAGDVCAYFGGNFFGKHKLLPNISPNKTVEGSLSGILGSLVAGCIYAHFFLPQSTPLIIAATSTLAAILAQMGDLFESLVKRVADVKDSGRIMPGHGGILDRIDGVYFAAPLVYAVSQWTLLPI